MFIFLDVEIWGVIKVSIGCRLGSRRFLGFNFLLLVKGEGFK